MPKNFLVLSLIQKINKRPVSFGFAAYYDL